MKWTYEILKLLCSEFHLIFKHEIMRRLRRALDASMGDKEEVEVIRRRNPRMDYRSRKDIAIPLHLFDFLFGIAFGV